MKIKINENCMDLPIWICQYYIDLYIKQALIVFDPLPLEEEGLCCLYLD
jgi:hypothetical protein